MDRSKGLGRLTAVAVAMGGLVISGAGMSHAVGLPGPVATVLAPVTAAASPLLAPSTGPSLPAPVGGLAALLTPSTAGHPTTGPTTSNTPSAAAAPAAGRGSATTTTGAAPSSGGSSATSSPGSVRATT